jgi:hypothetical protein
LFADNGHTWIASPDITTILAVILVVDTITAGGDSPISEDHTLTVNSAIPSGINVIAGGQMDGDVSNNHLIFEFPAPDINFAFGGISFTDMATPFDGNVTVKGNSVRIKAADNFTAIMGGASVNAGGTAEVVNNSVIFEGSIDTAIAVFIVYGGNITYMPGLGEYGTDNVASYNSVVINAGVEAEIWEIAGGHIDGPPSGDGFDASVLKYNSVELLGDGSDLKVEYLFGAYIRHGTIQPSEGASGPSLQFNSVKLERGIIGTSVFGAYVGEINGSTVSDNGVEITGDDVQITLDVIGGGWEKYISEDTDTIATRNWVKISTGSVGRNVVGGQISSGTAKSNEIYLSGGTVEGFVAGGYSAGTEGVGATSDNEVSISKDAVILDNVYGGFSHRADANDNKVLIADLATAVAGSVYGGYASIEPSDTYAASSNGNTVTIKNSHLNSDVFGGYSAASSGTAHRNTVRLEGKLELERVDLELTGGFASSAVQWEGNSLVMDNVSYATSTRSFGTVTGFEYFDFILTSDQLVAADVSQGIPAAVISSDEIFLGTDATAAKIKIDLGSGAALPSVGQKFLLFESASPVEGQVGSVSVGHHGMFTDIEYATDSDTYGITLEVKSITTREDAKALSELPLADVSFVNFGSDILASQAIPAAIASVSATVGATAFATIGYGWHRSETGSHVDVKGMNVVMGIAVGTETTIGPFMAGAFLEFGEGAFESYNEFANIPSVHGEGDLSYIGGGVFARIDAGFPGTSRPYFEASARFGKTDADFRTRDFFVAQGREISYGFGAKYRGFHAGAGYIIDFAGFNGTLDLSVKYFYLRREGDEFMIEDERTSLSSVTSSRIRSGARLTVGLTPSIRTYFGLYFEHEFDGDSQVFFSGTALPKATLRGSTGVGELGLLVSAPDSPLEVQLGIQGSAGRRDGISANLSLRYTF